MNNKDYPLGADNIDAPWNEDIKKPVNIKATISITLSKTVDLRVDDYDSTIDIDEDGDKRIIYDFNKCDLKGIVKQQIWLPNEAEEAFHDLVYDDKVNSRFNNILSDFKGWNVDDFEVVEE